MWFLSAIPVVGKIADAVASYFNKKQEVDLEKYKVKGNIDIEAMKQDTAIIQARVDLAKVMKGDPATNLGRLLILAPVGIYMSVQFYYLAFWNLLPDYLVWEPLDIPDKLQYIPYAAIAYLFATSFKR